MCECVRIDNTNTQSYAYVCHTLICTYVYSQYSGHPIIFICIRKPVYLKADPTAPLPPPMGRQPVRWISPTPTPILHQSISGKHGGRVYVSVNDLAPQTKPSPKTKKVAKPMQKPWPLPPKTKHPPKPKPQAEVQIGRKNLSIHTSRNIQKPIDMDSMLNRTR